MNARLAAAIDAARRTCRCGHVHYATRCHVCKYSEYDLAPEAEAPRTIAPQVEFAEFTSFTEAESKAAKAFFSRAKDQSRRPDAGTRFSGGVALVAIVVVAGVLAMAMLQAILERAAG